jgi:hypothetical protein
MSENNINSETKKFVTLITKDVLDEVAPEESSLSSSFVDTYFEINKDKLGDFANLGNNYELPLGVGSPDLVTVLVIPLVINFITEVVIKSGIATSVEEFVKQKIEDRKAETLNISIKLDLKKKDYETKIILHVKDKKKAKKILDATIKSTLKILEGDI